MQKILSSKPNSQTLRRSADRKNDHALRPIFLKGATIMDAIIYTTNTGSTGQYAKLLAQETGLPGLRSAIRCALSAASAWDKPERRQTACGKSQKFQPTFRCSPCKETSMLKSYTVFIDS